MCLTNHSSAFVVHDVRVVKNVACLSSLLKESFGISFPFRNLNLIKKIIQNTFNDMISIVFPDW